MVSLGNRGVSFISLIAATGTLFHSTIAFYKDLGFEEAFVYDREQLHSKREDDHALSSEKETWLQNPAPSPEQSITIKIRLIHRKFGSGVTSPGLKGTNNEDWRGSVQSIGLLTTNLDEIISRLNTKKADCQVYPEYDKPIEVYTHDPLGTLVGFTSKRNAAARTAGTVAFSRRLTVTTPLQQQTPSSPNQTRKKRIGVMTSGGDAPGMNAAVRAIVRMAIAKGCVPYAIYEGYEGLVQGGDLIREKSWEDVRGYLSEGGTLIGTARCAAFRERPGRLKAAKNLILKGIDAIIICGGDGSLTGADIFRSEWKGLLEELISTGDLTKEQISGHEHLNIVGLVGSIDNDMSSTDATIGAYSSLTRICQSVDFIDATAYSHSRAFVIEVMGRHCGWLALMAGVATGADFVFIPEKPPVEGWEDEMCNIIRKVPKYSSHFWWIPS